MTQPLVIIIMGSKADYAHCQEIADVAKEFDIEVVMRVGSAHKTPQHVLAMLREYEAASRPKVYITVAGRSNALSGFVDGATSAPVIACPPPSDAFGGADIFSSLRMPSAIAPALVLDPANAALLAAKILGLRDSRVHEKVVQFQNAQADKIKQGDREVNS